MRPVSKAPSTDSYPGPRQRATSFRSEYLHTLRFGFSYGRGCRSVRGCRGPCCPSEPVREPSRAVIRLVIVLKSPEKWRLGWVHGSCDSPNVRRVLLVIRGVIDPAALARCLADVATEGAELALCYELPPGGDGLRDGLAAQQALTAALRQIRGARAEGIPVFAASARDGERLEDYASAWGATDVKA